jgi:uncharacterized protein YqhQ
LKKQNKKKNPDFIHAESFKHGIMVRNDTNMIVTLRAGNGTIIKENVERPSLITKYSILKIPIIRGVTRFFEGSVNQFYASEISKKMLDQKEKEYTINKKSTYIPIILIVILAALVYFIAPTVITYFLKNQIKNLYFLNLIDIILRFIIFIVIFYIESKTKDIKKSAPYHGAEHKALFCYKKGEILTNENLKKQPIYHPSCGTNLIISMIIFYIPFILVLNFENLIFRIAIILLLMPLILGFSFDVTIWVGDSNSKLAKIVSFPGLMLQRLNTIEPDDQHLEIAKISFENLK